MSSTNHDQEKQGLEMLDKPESPRLTLDLPSPVTTASPQQQQQRPTPTAAKYKLSATAIIPVWIVLSSTVIIYNNYLYNTLNFRYPVFLVTYHLGFAALGTRVLQRTTNLLDGVKDVHMTKEVFARSILPIGMLFSGSLILSNTAYLYLSVAYIQMLKVRRALISTHWFDLRLAPTGIHTRRHPSHFVDIPHPGSQ